MSDVSPKNADEAFKQIDSDLAKNDGQKAYQDFIKDYNSLSPLERTNLLKKLDVNSENFTALKLEFEKQEAQKHQRTHTVTGADIHARELPSGGASVAEQVLAKQIESNPPANQNLAAGVTEQAINAKLKEFNLDQTAAAPAHPVEAAPRPTDARRVAPESSEHRGLVSLPDVSSERWNQMNLNERRNAVRDVVNRLSNASPPEGTMLDAIEGPVGPGGKQAFNPNTLQAYIDRQPPPSKENLDTAKWMMKHWDDTATDKNHPTLMEMIRSQTIENKTTGTGKKIAGGILHGGEAIITHTPISRKPGTQQDVPKTGKGPVTEDSLANAAGYSGADDTDRVKAMKKDQGRTHIATRSSEKQEEEE